MDFITLTGLQFYGFHGALSEETHLGQRFIVHLKLYLDLKQAGRTDSLSNTVDYAAVYKCVRNVVEGASVRLIERLAEQIARDVFLEFSSIQRIEVEVEKPGAPIPGVFGNVAAHIYRDRSEFI